jgi:hypothetical protein
MPLMTVKEMVEDILNDMDSDPLFTVSGGEDITATEESRQVVQILKTTYFNIIDGRPGGWSHLYNTFQLTATGASTPTTMTIPTNVMNFDYIKYDIQQAGDTKDKFREITYISPKEFLNITDGRDSSATEITQVTASSGILINVYNDRAPQYWTSPDDQTVIFDAHDAAVDATNLLAAKTQCYGQIYPTFTETDDFVPDLPTDAFSYYLAEAKSMCFLNIKQAGNPKVEAQAVTQRRRMSQEAFKINRGIKYANFGRKRVK